jgi:hypothetical protein
MISRPVRVRGAVRLAIVLSVAVILAATLFPSWDDVEPLLHCVLCGAQGLADFVRNIVLFAPLGIALSMANERLSRVCLAAALLSGAIELAQLHIPGRDPSAGDVLANTLGAAAGYVLVRYAPNLIELRGRAATWCALGAAVLPAFAVVATGALLRPALPHSTYFGQWTPNLGHLEWYGGQVRSAMLGQLSLPPQRLANPDTVRALLLMGTRLQLTAIAGPATTGLAPLFSIADDRYREIFLIGPDRDDLVLRYRTRSLTWRLDQPDLRFVSGLKSVHSGDSLTIAAWRERDGYCMSMNGSQVCHLRFTAGRGWGLLLYLGHLPPRGLLVLDAVWFAILLLPVGALARSRPEAWGAASLLVAAGILPLFVGLGATPLAGWIGGALGVAAGAWLRSAVAEVQQLDVEA